MSNIKDEIKDIKIAITNIERKIKMEAKEIKTIEEFEKVLKIPKVSNPKRSLWRTGSRKPDWESLEIMHKNGIPCEAWFQITEWQKKWKKESVRRKIENE
jgi:hypothetical protein